MCSIKAKGEVGASTESSERLQQGTRPSDDKSVALKIEPHPPKIYLSFIFINTFGNKKQTDSAVKYHLLFRFAQKKLL